MASLLDWFRGTRGRAKIKSAEKGIESEFEAVREQQRELHAKILRKKRDFERATSTAEKRSINDEMDMLLEQLEWLGKRSELISSKGRMAATLGGQSDLSNTANVNVLGEDLIDRTREQAEVAKDKFDGALMATEELRRVRFTENVPAAEEPPAENASARPQARDGMRNSTLERLREQGITPVADGEPE